MSNGPPIVFIVDDDISVRESLELLVSSSGWQAETFVSAREFLARPPPLAPSCLILDVMLPGKDGFEICSEIRRGGSIIPILFLSARADEPDRVGGLRAGADDYLVKPFSPRELLARVDALLRRSEIRPEPPSVIHLGNVELSPTRHDVAVGGQPLALTYVEFGLLAAMLERPEWVMTRGQLIDRLYTDDRLPALERTVDVHIFRLREKLQAAAANVAIVTIRGVGYKITAETT